MSKKFEIKNKSEYRAEIVLYADIGEGFFSDSVSANDFSKELDGLSKNISNIDVRINSAGGDVFDGITIYNRLKQHRARITTYVDGLAASIASIIALAGDEIVMGEGSYLMIHSPWTMTAGNADELEETIARLDNVEEQLISIYQRRTRIERSKLRDMLKSETWMDSTEAVELGFADKILLDNAPRMAASLDKAKWIKNKPNHIENAKEIMALDKINKILKK